MNTIGFTQNTESILDAYIKVKDALVLSDSKSAGNYVLMLQKSIETTNGLKEKETLLKQIEKMSRETDLEKQRIAFAELSVTMWKVIKKSDDLKEDVYLQYCPMKKTYWLSNEAAIRNPYYGSKMLTCGSVSEKKLK
jgi:hypothetical protein